MVINTSLASANSQTNLASLAKPLAKLAAKNAGATAAQNSNPPQLDSLSDELAVSSQNLAAASEITDPAMAGQVTAAMSSAILNQSSVALLAQANQIPQSVLSLLQP
jgi:flagellin